MYRYGVSRLTVDDIARGMKNLHAHPLPAFPPHTCLIRRYLSDIGSEARDALYRKGAPQCGGQ